MLHCALERFRRGEAGENPARYRHCESHYVAKINAKSQIAALNRAKVRVGFARMGTSFPFLCGHKTCTLKAGLYKH